MAAAYLINVVTTAVPLSITRSATRGLVQPHARVVQLRRRVEWLRRTHNHKTITNAGGEATQQPLLLRVLRSGTVHLPTALLTQVAPGVGVQEGTVVSATAVVSTTAVHAPVLGPTAAHAALGPAAATPSAAGLTPAASVVVAHARAASVAAAVEVVAAEVAVDTNWSR